MTPTLDDSGASDDSERSDVSEALISSAANELLPATLQPPLIEAASTLPTIYDDGCFADWDATEPGPCTYGDLDGDRTVVLYGDSHAAQWFPAMEKLALDRGWRLVVLTKASCPTMDIVVVARGEAPYPECASCREASIERIAREQVDVWCCRTAAVTVRSDKAASPWTSMSWITRSPGSAVSSTGSAPRVPGPGSCCWVTRLVQASTCPPASRSICRTSTPVGRGSGQSSQRPPAHRTAVTRRAHRRGFRRSHALVVHRHDMPRGDR